MGASSTKSSTAAASKSTSATVTVTKSGPPTDWQQWRQNQINCVMIQKLAVDVDAQYLLYQHYLGLQDMILLSQTCRIWCHWIHHPVRSSKSRSNRSHLAVITNAFDLKRLIGCQWIQPYLYGCKILPPLEWSNEWSRPQFSRLMHPPILLQLASLKHIQHLSLNHVHKTHLTREKIIAYFTALSSTLRSLELSMIELVEQQQLSNPSIRADPYAANPFLEQLHLLPYLEELRVSTRGAARPAFSRLNFDRLPELEHFHTFLSNFPLDPTSTVALGQCRQLKYCAINGFGAVETSWYDAQTYLQKFLSARRGDTFSKMGNDDPLEYLDLSPIRLNSQLLQSLSRKLPHLHTLNPYNWEVFSNEWSTLTQFHHLTDLQIVQRMTHGAIQMTVGPFLPYLIQCTTVRSLTLGHLAVTESQLQTILKHLNRLHTLTLNEIMLLPDDEMAPLPPLTESSIRDLARPVLGSRASDLRILLHETPPRPPLTPRIQLQLPSLAFASH